MTTTRNRILSSVANTPTTVYTNTTGKTAVLKSVNINGIGDSQTLNTVTGADEWLYHGTNMAPIVPTGFGGNPTYGYGVPISVPLSADRLLLIWHPGYMHNLGAMDIPLISVLHTQVVEYSNGKYRAGPIVNIQTTAFANLYTSTSITPHTPPSSHSTNYGASHLKAIALTPTKVLCAIRYSSTFILFRLNINGNSVELPSSTAAYSSLSVTGQFGTTPYAYDIAPVPSNADQVMVLAADTATWKAAAYSVPNSGSITQLGSTYNTTIAFFTLDGSICPTAKTASSNLCYFTAACPTSATAASINLFSYNNSTYAFTSINTGSITGSTTWRGVKAVCVSSDTTPNAIVATVDSGTPTTLRYYRQTSTTTTGTTLVSGTFNGSRSVANRTIRVGYNWGNSRAVFVGDNCLAVIDSSGTFTDLISSTLDSASTALYVNHWYNFESRPLYSFYDPNTIIRNRPAHYHARTGMANSTSVGTRTGQGNYFPWGHDYGNHYEWSEVAGCWIVGQGGKLYAISVDGDILSEVSLDTMFPALDNGTYQYDIRNVSVLPSGRILLCLAPYTMTFPTLSYFIGLQWTNVATTGYAVVTQSILNAKDLPKATISNFISLSNFACSAHLTSHVDFNGEERAYLIWHNGAAAPITNISQYFNGTWQITTQTSVTSTTSGTWNTGYNSRLKMIQTTPTSSLYPRGLWRFIGLSGTNTLVTIRSLYVGQQYDPLSQASSFTPALLTINDGNSTYSSHGMASKKSRNIAVITDYDNTVAAGNPTRIWTSIEGRLNNILGYYSLANTANSQYTSLAVSSRAYIVAHNNTTGVSNTIAQAYLFDTNDTANTRVTLANTSNSGFYTVKQVGSTTVEVYNAANSTNAFVDAVYTITGPNDVAKLSMSITDGSNTFFIANQMISTGNTTFIRTNDAYLLGNGASISVYADKPYALSALLSIVEE